MTSRSLALALAETDTFTTAPCVGKWRLFDAREPYEPTKKAYLRHLSARILCGKCPRDVKKACRALAETEPREMGGVWAGKLYDRSAKPP